MVEGILPFFFLSDGFLFLRESSSFFWGGGSSFFLRILRGEGEGKEDKLKSASGQNSFWYDNESVWIILICR